MQSDAFPTPLIYSLQLQPRLIPDYVEELDSCQEDVEDSHDYQHLIQKISMLVADCSPEEAQALWIATEQIKIRHQIAASMQKIENVFLDFARDCATPMSLPKIT
ncbi:MAG: hypothetical protein AUK48_04530 [Oscillatoriales cyanobacterium CG2_30_44_21]|nr:MAG: hypothetical protein AUK48_04530 [Oscillatoriales cyanobacterium CG2_30_44_21]